MYTNAAIKQLGCDLEGYHYNLDTNVPVFPSGAYCVIVYHEDAKKYTIIFRVYSTELLLATTSFLEIKLHSFLEIKRKAVAPMGDLCYNI